MGQVDWKKASDYPPVKGTSLQLWAYKFLMRNPDFISKMEQARKEVVPISDSEPIGWSATPVGKVLREFGVDHPYLKEWMEEGLSDSPVKLHTHPKYVHGYLVDKAGAMFTDQAIGKRYKIALESLDKVVLEFDLTQPINPQIARAKAMLMTSQARYGGKKRKTGKAMVKLYPFYLRVLDAYYDNASPFEICNVLSLDYEPGVGTDTLRNWRLEAERLRDGGYLDLVKNPNP